MRLIDADALKEEICKCYRHFSQRLSISPVFEEIEKAPSLDAVPAVVCKDCKHKDKYENFCWTLLREIDPSDYCSWAEREQE